MTFQPNRNVLISVEKQGSRTIKKDSFPLRYGTYSEIKTDQYEFIFNLNGEIKFIRNLTGGWPHPAEQLKRTDGNDWVYYTVGDRGGGQGIIAWLGEYYLPCLPYPSNPIWEIDYLSIPIVMNAFAAWWQLVGDLHSSCRERKHPRVKALIRRILDHDDTVLLRRAQELNAIIGGRVSVLPPDTRHVDYEVVPLTIADGCLYHCDFCCVQSSQPFKMRSRDNILDQVGRLKGHYGPNLANYQALFLGNHDALGAGGELIGFAASTAHKIFGFEKRLAELPFLFMFGSVGSLLKADDRLFDQLNQLPFYTFINIGFESIDPSTLKWIGKPLTATMVRDAFGKMIDVNRSYSKIEITGNFLLGDQLPHQHYHLLGDLLGKAAVSGHRKGAIYLSPLKDSPKKRELLPTVIELQQKSRLPVFVYLIQRL